MALKNADFVKESTTTTGVGHLLLSGAEPGFRTFSDAIGAGNTCLYTIQAANGFWESGVGTISASNPSVLERTTLIASTTGSKLNLPSGTHYVFCAPSAKYYIDWTDDQELATIHPGNLPDLSSIYASSVHTHTSNAISDGTGAGRNLLTAATAAEQRSLLGLGTAATTNADAYTAASHVNASAPHPNELVPVQLVLSNNDEEVEVSSRVNRVRIPFSHEVVAVSISCDPSNMGSTTAIFDAHVINTVNGASTSILTSNIQLTSNTQHAVGVLNGPIVGAAHTEYGFSCLQSSSAKNVMGHLLIKRV